MMKKLIALVLVLAMASLAAATVTQVITVNGETWTGASVKGSDQIVVELYDDAMFMGNFNIGTSVNVDHGDYTADSFSQPPGSILGQWTIDDPVSDGFTIWGNMTYMMVGVPGDDLIFTFEFHVPEDLDASSYINIDWSGTYSALALTGFDQAIHVPEPMTIALLGLGGLFLLRRRR